MSASTSDACTASRPEPAGSVPLRLSSVTALVGPSGAGKSTLCSLVSRLYDVTDGAVRIDGQDVRDVTRASVARAVGDVSQDVYLFHESVASNMRYARPDATDAEIEAACRHA